MAQLQPGGAGQAEFVICDQTIELLFKRWKSQGGIAKWADSGNEWRVLCEVYGKLLAMVLSHWVVVASCWADAGRSLVGAAAVVREYAPALVSSWGHDAHVVEVLEVIQRVIKASCHMSKRRKHPSTYQLLRNPELVATTGGLA